jgi:stringent starvation protein B
VFSRESGRGMEFEAEDVEPPPPETPTDDSRPRLRVVK